MYVIIGWIGAFLFIVAYFLLSINLLKSNGIIYHTMNVLGAICLIINALNLDDNPGFFVNLIWMFIGLFAMINIIKNKWLIKTK